MIYLEVISSIINVVEINQWYLLKTLFTGTAVADFNDILYKASITGPRLVAAEPTTNATCPGIQALWGLNVVIASEQGGR